MTDAKYAQVATMDNANPHDTNGAVTTETTGHARPAGVTCKAILLENIVLLLTLAGVVIGFAVGFGVRELRPSADALMWIGMPGELFMRFLNLVIVPLIVGSVISGTAQLDAKSNGKMTFVALTWIVATNTIACILAVILSISIRPGGDGGASDFKPVVSRFETQDIFADLLRNLVPSNAVEIGFRKAVTSYSTEKDVVQRPLPNGTLVNETVTSRIKSNDKSDGSTNVLGLIMVSLLFGIAANRLGERADVFIRFFSGLTDIVLMVMRWFFWTSPLGVSSLIARSVASIDDLADSFSKLGMFIVVVVVGIAIMQLVLLSLLLFAVTRRNPLAFHFSILRPYLIGFASTSTAVAIPEMLHCCEVKNRVDPRVARFAIPFSVTLSSNGSAIFIVTSVIFIAQYIGHSLSAGDVIVVVFLTSVSSMALPSVPSSSLVALVMIMAAVNIPAQTIALLFTVEWFTDRVRTGCNVVSHCYCAAITFRFCQADLNLQQRSQSTGLGDANKMTSADSGMKNETSRL